MSVGFVDGPPLLDLAYAEDSRAEVDMNVAMTDAGAYVEVQGTAEAGRSIALQLDALLGLAQVGIERLFAVQRGALGGDLAGSCPLTPSLAALVAESAGSICAIARCGARSPSSRRR